MSNQDQCCSAMPPLSLAGRVKMFIVGRFRVACWHMKLLFLRLAYRHIMRLSHYFGWHYAPIKPGPEGTTYRWCHWCGLRGEVYDPKVADRLLKISNAASKSSTKENNNVG